MQYDDQVRTVRPNFAPVTVTLNDSEADDELVGWRRDDITAVRVRGSKMRTVDSLFDEFAAAMQFPWYFGENEAAFEECMTDLEWLGPPTTIVVLIANPIEILQDQQDAMAWLTRALDRVCLHWSTPVVSGEYWDRPAVPFNVLVGVGDSGLHGVPDEWRLRALE